MCASEQVAQAEERQRAYKNPTKLSEQNIAVGEAVSDIMIPDMGKR
jgi:hypothetical protein